MMEMKRAWTKLLLVTFVLVISNTYGAEGIDWYEKRILAGRVDLISFGYIEWRVLGELGGAIELSLPVELVYESKRDTCGIFGNN